MEPAGGSAATLQRAGRDCRRRRRNGIASPGRGSITSRSINSRCSPISSDAALAFAAGTHSYPARSRILPKQNAKARSASTIRSAAESFLVRLPRSRDSGCGLGYTEFRIRQSQAPSFAPCGARIPLIRLEAADQCKYIRRLVVVSETISQFQSAV